MRMLRFTRMIFCFSAALMTAGASGLKALHSGSAPPDSSRETGHHLTLIFPDFDCSRGSVMIAIHRDAKGFPSEKPFAEETISCDRLNDNRVTVRLPEGRFAVAAFHDVNDNRELDRNLFRIPAEPFGFSNNPRILTGPPDFEDAAFHIARDLEIQIILK